MSPRAAQADVTPTLAEVIRTVIDAKLVDLHTSLPGKVVDYDSAKQTATVKISLMRMYEGETQAVELPPIPNVPVVWPRTAKAQVHLPLAADDDVWLIFSERSLDQWKSSGGVIDPKDRRRHNLTDAVALVGGTAPVKPFTVNDPESIEIVNDQGKVQIKSDGTVNLGDYAPQKSVALGEAVEARLEAIENGITTLISSLNANVTVYTAHVHPTTSPGAPTGPPAAPESPISPFTPDTSVVSSEKVKVVP